MFIYMCVRTSVNLFNIIIFCIRMNLVATALIYTMTSAAPPSQQLRAAAAVVAPLRAIMLPGPDPSMVLLVSVQMEFTIRAVVAKLQR